MSDSLPILHELESYLDLGEKARSFTIGDGAVGVVVKGQDLPAAAGFIDRTLDARFVISVGTDVRAAGQGFRVDHIFSQDRRKTWIVLRTHAPADDPRVVSITPTAWRAASSACRCMLIFRLRRKTASSARCRVWCGR